MFFVCTTLNACKVFFVTFNLNGRFHAIFVRKSSQRLLVVFTVAWHRDSPTNIELLEPAEGSVPGDRVFIDGYEMTQAADILNPKKKIWDRLQVTDWPTASNNWNVV